MRPTYYASTQTLNYTLVFGVLLENQKLWDQIWSCNYYAILCYMNYTMSYFDSTHVYVYCSKRQWEHLESVSIHTTWYS